MDRLIPITKKEDIPAEYQDNYIGRLFEYHNLGRELESYDKAQLFIGMCMDHRKRLRIPENFAYVMRTGGANLRHSEFKISYAIAVGGVRSIALIAHDNCGMVNLMSRKEKFVNGLVENAGWEATKAEDHFFHFAPMFEIGNEIDFVMSEVKRLRLRYPKIKIAPLFYKLDENRLYLLREE